MTPDTLPPQIPTDTLRDQAIAAIRERWVPPHPPAARHVVLPHEADALARTVLDTMLTRQFRVAKLPPDEDYAQLLAKVRHWVAKGKPIRVMQGYAPMKNLNAVRVSRADWAEFFALTHLCAWHNKVCSVYPPGLRIKIVFDDSTISMANRPDRRHMDGYIRSVGRLVQVLGYESFIVGTMRQSAFAWLFNFGLYQWAERRVRRFERDPANQAVVEQMDSFALRNVYRPPGIDDAAHERACRAASHRYRVYWEALQLSGFSRLGHNLVSMYLDGNQHHIRQQAALHLTTVGKGQITQPWQGEGVLQDNGKGTLIPIVLTAGRRGRMICQEIAQLDLVPMEGFDTLQVCRETASTS
jgi:hypothetical protein